MRGVIVGETYIDQMFNQSGYDVFHPENLSVAEQITKYRSYKKIVFSEGSALHAIQMIGRLEADIVIIMRRPFTKLASASLVPRANSVTYINAVECIFSGITRNGMKYYPSAITFINLEKIVNMLHEHGICLRGNVETPDFSFHEAVAVHKWLCFLKIATQNRQQTQNVITKLGNLRFFERYKEHAHLFEIDRIWNA